MSREQQPTTSDTPEPDPSGDARTGTARERRAVVLLSGGLDSTTVLALARSRGLEVYALTVRYGQRHACELEAARAVARTYGAIEHREVVVDLGTFGGSALTDDIPVPSARAADRPGDGIPVTYVPARNTIFLSVALAWAEVLDAGSILIGVNAVDYSGYPDCRPEFIAAFESLASLATKTGAGGRAIRIEAPLIDMSKAQIIRVGHDLGVDYGLTTSCYDPGPDGTPCRRCEACDLRDKGFETAGLIDPARARGRPDTRS